MKRWWFGWVLWGWAVAWTGAESQGFWEAKTSEGRLTLIEAGWQPEPGWAARWWWRETSGSGWLRAQGLELGPLTLRPGPEGTLRWGPTTLASSGHWGLGYDGGAWGLWAVQSPTRFRAGAQGQGVAGPWTLALGGDRAWDLKPGVGTDPRWIDSVRVGLRMEDDGLTAGWEGSVEAPSRGPGGWAHRGRLSAPWGPGWVGAKGSVRSQGGRGAQGQWELRGAWDAWDGLWAGTSEDPVGRTTVWWAASGFSASTTWGHRGGWGGSLGVEVPWDDLKLWVDSSWVPRLHGRELRVGWGVRGPLVPGRWDLQQTWTWDPSGWGQTLEGGFTRESLEATAEWRAEGLRLGWLGPGTRLALTLRWTL